MIERPRDARLNVGHSRSTLPRSQGRYEQRSPPALKSAVDVNKLACAALLLLAIFFGGGTTPGLTGDWLVELAAVPVLGMGVWRLRLQPSTRLERWGLIWLALVALVFALQCIPLPASLWTALGGRAELADEMARAGVSAGAHTLSLNPYATERMLWTLLPPAAVFVGAVGLREPERLDLLQIVFILTVLSVMVGLAQVAGGPESGLRFYAITNPTEAVGFFANRNHYSALLYMMLPLVLATFGAGLLERHAGRDVPMLTLVGFGLMAILLIMGLVLARSRAGLVLGMIGLVVGLLAIASVAWRAEARSRIARVVAVTTVLGIVLAVQYGLYGILERLQNDPADDARWTLLATTLQAARHFGEWGSGFGTFVNAYQSFEAPAIMFPAYANHAHNDWAELWLEGGWLAAVLAVLLMLWLGVAIWRAWRSQNSSPLISSVRRAASISVLLILLHETVDYCLRTTAILCIFALLCASITNSRESDVDGIDSSQRRSRTS